MYADDMILFSETIEGLQNMLSVYTEKWDLSVNTNKTKIVVFRRDGNIA